MNSPDGSQTDHISFTANGLVDAMEQLDRASRCDKCNKPLEVAMTFFKGGPYGGKVVLYCEGCGITKEQTHGNDSPNPAPPEERR